MTDAPQTEQDNQVMTCAKPPKRTVFGVDHRASAASMLMYTTRMIARSRNIRPLPDTAAWSVGASVLTALLAAL